LHHTSRAVAAAVSLTAISALTACGPAAPPGKPGAGWSFTDDRGITVTRPELPRQIVAQVSAAAALEDFGVEVAGTFGPLVRDDGTVEPEAAGLDPAEVTDVTGPGYGEINLERLATLHPDLVVSGKYAEYAGLWHLVEEHERKVTEFAPTVGVQQSGLSLPEAIGKYERLARALGGDVDSERVRADERAFHAAADRLRGIGERMRAEGRSILGIGGTKQEFFVVVPQRNPDLDYYVRELGLPIIAPKHPDEATGGYFERLSWENADAYEGDVLLWDARAASMRPEEMKRNPVFAATPAAAAGKFVEWDAVAPLSYASYARIMNELADRLESQLA
jgi:iron complex transport system substrate-binding protein